jgi:hypothetical protein
LRDGGGVLEDKAGIEREPFLWEMKTGLQMLRE